MSEALMFAAAVIAALLSLLAALWLFGCVNYDDAIGEPVLTAKPEPRRVRAGQPVVDLEACERAGMLAAVVDFDDDTKTTNTEIYHSQAFAVWAVAYEKTTHDLHEQAAESMLPQGGNL